MERTAAQIKGARTTVTQEEFEGLLGWLDPDRETAGRRYEEIRYDLIGRFRAHGCATPEDLADETLNRVARKISDIASFYTGDRRPYFYRVAYYVQLEHLRKEVRVVELADEIPTDVATDEPEMEFECLERCLDGLPQQNREIILTYYQGERRKKIELRKQLAESLRIELPNLRLKAQRIRDNLKRCILNCLESESV